MNSVVHPSTTPQKPEARFPGVYRCLSGYGEGNLVLAFSAINGVRIFATPASGLEVGALVQDVDFTRPGWEYVAEPVTVTFTP